MTPTPRAALLSVGDEILLGQQLDTNSAWLAAALAGLGWIVDQHRTVADDRAAIASALRELAEGHGAVIVTGGLGPTLDDLTREALGDVIAPGQPLLEDPAGVAHLHCWFTARGRAMSASNLRQAMCPPGARLLANPNGTAPGLAARWRFGPGANGPGGKGPSGNGPMADACSGTLRLFFCLPGPPREMQPMFRDHVAPELVGAAEGSVVLTATVPQIGLGESVAAERLGELMERGRNPSVGTTASGGIVKARVRVERDASRAADARRELDTTVEHVLATWAPYAFARSDSTLVEALAALLRERRLSLAVAESCTGGLLGATIVDFPGASDFFVGGFLTYSNALKTALLGVPEALLEAHGAVSEPTARAMALAAADRTDASCALAITGVAGPAGGSPEKPVGTVFIAVTLPRGGERATRVRRFQFTGDRRDIRERAAAMALQMLRLELLGETSAPLLWEQ